MQLRRSSNAATGCGLVVWMAVVPPPWPDSTAVAVASACCTHAVDRVPLSLVREHRLLGMIGSRIVMSTGSALDADANDKLITDFLELLHYYSPPLCALWLAGWLTARRHACKARRTNASCSSVLRIDHLRVWTQPGSRCLYHTATGRGMLTCEVQGWRSIVRCCMLETRSAMAALRLSCWCVGVLDSSIFVPASLLHQACLDMYCISSRHNCQQPQT